MANTQPAAPQLRGVDIQGITRSSFILRGALAAGGVYGAGAVGPFVARALAQASGSDVGVLNFALTLEFLEAEFYERALSDANLDGELRKLAEEIGKNEAEHVDTLRTTIEGLGGKPAAAPRVRFDLKDRDSFLDLAVRLEDTGVSAYNGAVPAIDSGDILSAAGAIVQVESRHAAAVRLEAGEDPAPAAFDRTLSDEEVQDAIRPFLRS
jgi:rubrerythrin